MEKFTNDYLKLYKEYYDAIIDYHKAYKEAYDMEYKYYYVFGILEINKCKLEVDKIKYTKEISYLLTNKNKIKKIQKDVVESYARRNMNEENKNLSTKRSILDTAIYRHNNKIDAKLSFELFSEIVKVLHPGLHINLKYSVDVKELFYLALSCYYGDNIEGLKYVYDEVMSATNANKEIEEISNIELRINKYKKKKEKVLNSYPYNLCIHLKDEDSINKQKNLIKEDIKKLSFEVEELELTFKTELEGNFKTIV